MDRRDFLSTSAYSLISACFLASCRSAPVYKTNNGSAFLFFESENGLSRIRVMNLDTFAFEEVVVPIVNPHSALRVSSEENGFAVFDFMGAAAKVNLKTKEAKKILNPEGRFMGHSTQTGSDAIVWSTEIMANGQTMIRARNASDLSLITGAGTSFPGGHHIVKMPGSDHFATSFFNLGNNKPSVRFHNYKTNQFVECLLPLPVLVSHLLPISTDEVICITNQMTETPYQTKNKDPLANSTYDLSMKVAKGPKSAGRNTKFDIDLSAPSPLIYANTKGEVRAFWPEEKSESFRYGFGLDSIRNAPRKYVTGHTLSNTVAVWNNETLEDLISVSAPMGVLSTSDGKRLVILSEGILKIYSLEKKTFENDHRFDRKVTAISRYS